MVIVLCSIINGFSMTALHKYNNLLEHVKLKVHAMI